VCVSLVYSGKLALWWYEEKVWNLGEIWIGRRFLSWENCEKEIDMVLL
jgi:hypothetical protein